MKLIMLGTGNALVTECYNTCFILSNDNNSLLVDTGGGNTILSQIKHAGFALQDIHDVFITHSHIDHILGAIWVIRITSQLMNRDMYSGDLHIYSHDEVIALLYDMVQKFLLPYQAAYVGTRIHLHTLHDNERLSLIGQEFRFFDIHSERTKQYGFRMTFGGENITYSNTSSCSGEHITCSTKVLTFCGDEPCSPQCEHFARNADWLIHEAFCLYSEADTFKPYEKHHSTVKDTAALAQRLHVKNIIICHTEDSDLAHRKVRYTSEGREYFSGNIYVPDDLETLTLL